MPRKRCPICDSPSTDRFLHRRSDLGHPSRLIPAVVRDSPTIVAGPLFQLPD